MADPNIEALQEAIRRASRVRAPLCIVGGRTKDFCGEKPAGDVLDVRSVAGIVAYEPSELVVTARAGTPLAELETAMREAGQMLAFEPPRFGPGGTLGGAVAAGLSGPRRPYAGAARDFVLGADVIDGTGRALSFGGRVMKNVTGYDLVKLMAGSRGALGVLTEVALKTAPIPPAARLLRLPGLAAAEALAPLTLALTGPFDVSAALWLPGQGALIRLEGLPGSVAIRAEALAARLAGFAPETADPSLCLGENILGGPGADGPRSGGDLWRILCRPSQAAAILAGLPEPLRLDWGGALILARLPEGAEPPLPPGAIATRLTGAPARLPPPDPVTARLEAVLATRFDPRGLFGGVR